MSVNVPASAALPAARRGGGGGGRPRASLTAVTTARAKVATRFKVRKLRAPARRGPGQQPQATSVKLT
jgi:hypothetical protein